MDSGAICRFNIVLLKSMTLIPNYFAVFLKNALGSLLQFLFFNIRQKYSCRPSLKLPHYAIFFLTIIWVCSLSENSLEMAKVHLLLLFFSEKK